VPMLTLNTSKDAVLRTKIPFCSRKINIEDVDPHFPKTTFWAHFDGTNFPDNTALTLNGSTVNEASIVECYSNYYKKT